MSGLFSRWKVATSGALNPSPSSQLYKKNTAEPEIELTPLLKMLQNADPVRNDGSDKFYGMENFGNTCYCNSIIQALYYSVPFREYVVKYPTQVPHDYLNGNPKVSIPTRAPMQNGGAVLPAVNQKGISAAEAAKRRAGVNTGQNGLVNVLRPEDKPDSPEYKKKQAMLTGPIIELTYENATSYGMEESTFTALKDIFLALITSNSRTGVLSPQRFLEIFKRDHENFRNSMHQDAHEFYGLMLNAVINNVETNSQQMKQQPFSPELSRVGKSTDSKVASAAPAMDLGTEILSPGKGWVHDIFQGVLTSETKCLTCETTSQRDETFLDLSIDLDEHSSISSCLRKFSAEEMLCKRNKFHCDNCGGLQEAEKRMKIKRLPKVLALHLKRFDSNGESKRFQKLFHRVVYPYHLRMFNTTDDAEDPDRLYELYAVVVHIGGNVYHGHYVSVIKTQDRGWLLFDDEMVEPVDKNYVRNFFGDKPGMACAYVLFYQETTVEDVRREQEAEDLDEELTATGEARIDSGKSQSNGLPLRHIATNSGTEDTRDGASLDHAISAPVPIQPQRNGIPPVPLLPSRFPTSASLNSTKVKSKNERALEKKSKETAKALELSGKRLAKERQKVEELRQKEKKDCDRNQAEEFKHALAASKVSAATEEEHRKFAHNGSTSSETVQENGHSEYKEKQYFLGRGHIGSKSMSRKSFAFLGGKNSDSGSSKAPPSTSPTDDGEAVEVSMEPQTPEKHVKSTKERFTFGGLGRKKSRMMKS